MEKPGKYVETLDFLGKQTIHVVPTSSAWIICEPNGQFITAGGSNTYVGQAARHSIEQLYSTDKWTPYIEAVQRPQDVRTAAQKVLIQNVLTEHNATEVVFAVPREPTGTALILLATLPEIKL